MSSRAELGIGSPIPRSARDDVPPMLVDTHCHLADPAYDPDRSEVLGRAWSSGVAHIVVIGESPEASDRALALAAGEPRLTTTAGIHPHDAKRWGPEAAAWLRERLRHPRVVAA